MASGEFSPLSLDVLEQAFEQCLQLAGRVFADTWNLNTFSACSSCFAEREKRLQAINLTQTSSPPVVCPKCSSGPTDLKTSF